MPQVDLLYSIRAGGPGPRPGLRRFHLLFAGGQQIARAAEAGDLLAAFERDLHLWVVASCTRLVFLHAGVVLHRGRLLLFPGNSLSGKSSLVAEFLRRGAVYFSDDYAVVDLSGRVYPYPRPLQLRHGGGHSQSRIDLHQLGAATAGQPAHPAALIFTRYQEGGSWRPRRLDPAPASLELLKYCVGGRTTPALHLRVAGLLAGRTPAIRSRRGEAPETVDRVTAWLETLPETAVQL